MTASSYLPPSSLKREPPSADLALAPHSTGDCLLLWDGNARPAGGFFFQAIQSAHGYLAKLFTGGPLVLRRGK